MKIKTNFSAEDCVRLAQKYKYNLLVFRGELYNKEDFVDLISKITKKNINTTELYAVIHDAVTLKNRDL